MGFIRNAKERRIAKDLNKQALLSAATDPEVEVVLSPTPDPNPAHGQNTRRELRSEARHVRTNG